jgi:hypothetical protein
LPNHKCDALPISYRILPKPAKISNCFLRELVQKISCVKAKLDWKIIGKTRKLISEVIQPMVDINE